MLTTMLARVARGPRGLATGSWALAEATFARHELVRSPCGSRSLRTGHITSFRDEVSLQGNEGRRRRGLVLPAATTTSRGFSSTAGEEKRETWHEKQNAQGRLFYENASTGTRSWERPSPDVAVVKSLAEVEIEEEERREREAREAASAKRKEYKGDSLMMRVVDNFWRVVDLARRTYWAGIVAAAIYVLSELYKDFA